MPQMKTLKLSEIRVGENVRKSYDPQEMEELIASVRQHGILTPLLVMKDMLLLAGHRRKLAAEAAKLVTVPAIMTDEMLTDSQIKVIQLTENLQRSELTDPEMFVACSELMTLNPQWSKGDLATQIGKSPATVTRILSVQTLVPDARAAFMAGKIGLSAAYAISQVSAADQPGLLALKLSGASRDAVEKASRKARAPRTGKRQVKATSVKCRLPSGYTVTVSGANGVSLDDAPEALADAIKEVKRAKELGYTAKTFEAAMRDKAAKG